MKKYIVMALPIICAVFLVAPMAMADPIYSFFNITDNGNGAALLAPQLTVVVTDPGGGEVRFEFHNDGGIASSITDIYFDDGSLLGIASIVNGSVGVSFNHPAVPGDLPGGDLASPPFVTTDAFSADSDAPIMANGVNPGEWVAIIFDLQSGATYANVISEINSGAIRMGLHVQAIGTVGGSDSFVNDGQTTAEPASMILLGSGLIGCSLFIRRKSKKQTFKETA